MGLSDLIRIENVVPQEGLHNVWNLLFSGVSQAVYYPTHTLI